jgi:hypothetical protein
MEKHLRQSYWEKKKLTPLCLSFDCRFCACSRYPEVHFIQALHKTTKTRKNTEQVRVYV